MRRHHGEKCLGKKWKMKWFASIDPVSHSLGLQVAKLQADFQAPPHLLLRNAWEFQHADAMVKLVIFLKAIIRHCPHTANMMEIEKVATALT